MSTNLSSNYSQFNFAMVNPCKKVIYEFETFRLDAAHLLLYRDGQEIPLAPKVVETLLVLVENAGEIIGKDELMEKIWAGSIVEESNLSQNLFRLRKVLGETKSGKPFVETLRRRGYRFAPDVEIIKTFAVDAETAVNFKNVEGQEIKNAAGGNFSPEIETSPELPFADFHALSGNGFPKCEAENVSERTVPRSQNRWRAAFILAIAAFVAAVSLGFALVKKIAVSVSREVKLKRLTAVGSVGSAAISPDGNSLVYTLRQGAKSSLRIKNILTESEIVVIPPSQSIITSPRFSPDGNFIYYETREGVYQMPVFGDEARLVASNLGGGFSISPDGRQIAFPRSESSDTKTSIVISQIDGGIAQIIPARPEPDFYVGLGQTPAWSLDGERLTVMVERRGDKEKRLIEIDLQTGAERKLEMQDDWQEINFMRWVSRETLFVAAQKKGEIGNQIWSIKFPEGTAERITNDLNDYLGFSFNRNADKIVAVPEVENICLWLFDKETSMARQITSGINRGDGRFGLALAPDAKRIVYTTRDKNSYNIYSVSTDNSDDVQQLTKNAGQHNLDPAISPDGRSIAFVSDRTGTTRLWLMNTDGGEARQITPTANETENSENSPYFSPDGRWIYYVFYQSDKGSIRKISIDGGEPIEVSQMSKDVYEPVVSPNGKFLAHAIFNDEAKASGTLPWQIGVITLDSSMNSERFFSFPAFRQRSRWSPDSQSLVSIDEQAGYNLWETSLADGARQPITDFKNDKIYRFDASPDGRFYALARGDYFHDAILIER